jgi:hypothetical protein
MRKIPHLIPPPEFKKISKANRDSYLKPKDEISEASFEESVRESMRKSIES